MSDPLVPTLDATPAASPATEADPIKNLKAEMSRKLDNYGADIQKLTDTLNGLLQPKPTQDNTPNENVGELLWKDPVRATQIIEDRATKKITAQINEEKAREQRQVATLQAVYNDYPEMSDSNHPATQKAVEIFNKMTKEEQANPLAIKYAAREAAVEFDLKPKSKRSVPESESFTLSGGRTSSGRREGSTSEFEKQVAQTAAVFGLDLSNEKTRARLKEKANRSDWMNYKDLK